MRSSATDTVASAESGDEARQDLQVPALLRAPGDAVAYAGDMEVDAAHVAFDTHLKTQYGIATVIVVERHQARAAALDTRFPGKRVTPVQSLMCAGPDVPALDGADLFRRGRAMFHRGCRD